MTREQVKEGLLEILKTIRSIDQESLKNISEDSDFITDLGCPSTEIINIVAKAENHFDIEFDDDDVDDLGSTVKEIIDIIIKTNNAKLS